MISVVLLLSLFLSPRALAAASSSCSSVSLTTVRMVFDKPGCIHVSGAFFSGLHTAGVDGGAIYCVEQETGSAIVQDSTFRDCVVSGGVWWGGACHFRYPSVVMLRCCGNSCKADKGHFCYFKRQVAGWKYRMEFSQMSQVLCGTFTTSKTRILDGGLYLHESVDATINHCNFSHNQAQSGSALFCDGTTGVFNSSWLTVYNNKGDTGVETLRDTTPRVSYANFIKNPVTAYYGLVYANNYGMILTKCCFVGNHINTGIWDIYRSNSEKTSYVFELWSCYFDQDLPEDIHVKVMDKAYTKTITSLQIQHHDASLCPAEFHYQSSPFTDSANLLPTPEIHQSRLPAPSGRFEPTKPVSPSIALQVTTSLRASSAPTLSGAHRASRNFVASPHPAPSGVLHPSHEPKESELTRSASHALSSQFGGSIRILATDVLKPSVRFALGSSPTIADTDFFIASALSPISQAHPLSSAFATSRSFSISAAVVVTRSFGSSPTVTHSVLVIATAVSPPSQLHPLSSAFSSSTSLQISPVIVVTKSFGPSDTRITSLFSPSETANTPSESTTLANISPSAVEQSPTVLFSVSAALVSVVSPHSASFPASHVTGRSNIFIATSSFPQTLAPGRSLVLISTASFARSSLPGRSPILVSTSSFDHSLAAGHSVVIVSSASFSQSSSPGQTATFASTVSLHQSSPLGHSATFASTPSFSAAKTQPGASSTARNFASSALHSATFADTEAPTSTKGLAAELTTGKTWTVAGISFAFLLVLVAAAIWFIVFKRRKSESEELSIEAGDAVGFSMEEITMEEYEEMIEGMNPLMSSGDEDFFAVQGDEGAFT
jgi:hypothetical protein